MDLARSLTYGLPIIGVLLFSISIGGAVLGGYASIQEDFGHCGDPLIHVTPPDQTGPLSESGAMGPSYPVLHFQELSAAEQRGFREALARVDNIGKVNATLVHFTEFENGAIVLYQGERYYTTVESENACLGLYPFVLPLGIIGTIIGAGLIVTPSLWKQLGRPDFHDLKRDELVRGIFDGQYTDFWVFIAFTLGVLLGLLHWVGLLIGTMLVGITTSSIRRAGVLGLYLSCTVVLLFAAYDSVISTLIGVPSGYPQALFSTMYPSFVTAIPLAVLVSVVARISTRRLTSNTAQ